MSDEAVTSLHEAKAVRAPARGRREEILVAAAQCFADMGYHTVGMRDIATAVGIKGASLYNHFSSKEEIMYAIALGMTRDLVDKHMPILDAAGTPTDRLTELIRAHIRTLSEKRLEHLVSLRELKALSPEHLAEVTDIRKYYQRRVRDVIAAGVRSGEFDVENPALTAIALLDMINGISWWLRPEHDIDDLAEMYVGFALQGILQYRRRIEPEAT